LSSYHATLCSLSTDSTVKQPTKRMLLRETVRIYCQNHTEHTNTVRTSQETHYVSATETNRLMLLREQSVFTVRTIWNTQIQETHYASATEPNRLMLFRETVAVYCENHTEHTNPVRPSQETHYDSSTKTNRLMLLRETVAVYCENHTEHTNALCGQKARF
jgi:translation initiation factor IF-1